MHPARLFEPQRRVKPWLGGRLGDDLRGPIVIAILPPRSHHAADDERGGMGKRLRHDRRDIRLNRWFPSGAAP